MYNFALAFVLCAAVYIIGEVVSTATKAWIPSVFVTAAIILVGYWTVLPTTLISDAVLIPFGSTIGIYLLITHMGTVISIKQLLEQWKTIVVCLAGLAGMCVLALFVLKSTLSQYIAIAALLGQHGEELELWCSNREDEAKFLHMFQDNPEMM